MSAETRQAGKNILHRNKSPPQTIQKQQSALVSFILTRHRSVTLTQPRLTSEHWQESLVSVFYHMYKIRLPDWLHVYRVQVLHKQLFSFPWPTKPAQPNAASSCTLMTLHWSLVSAEVTAVELRKSWPQPHCLKNTSSSSVWVHDRRCYLDVK